jgi:hypothetical protein
VAGSTSQRKKFGCCQGDVRLQRVTSNPGQGDVRDDSQFPAQYRQVTLGVTSVRTNGEVQCTRSWQRIEEAPCPPIGRT